MQNTLASLNRLLEAIDRAKPEKARLDGEKKILVQNLIAEFQIKSIKEARSLLSTWNAEKVERRTRIMSSFRKLKKAYRW